MGVDRIPEASDTLHRRGRVLNSLDGQDVAEATVDEILSGHEAAGIVVGTDVRKSGPFKVTVDQDCRNAVRDLVRKSGRVADRNRDNSVHAPGTEHTQRTFEILLILKRVGEQRVVAGEFEILDHGGCESGEERVVYPRNRQTDGERPAGPQTLGEQIGSVIHPLRLRPYYVYGFLADPGSLSLAGKYTGNG